jgi:ABC-type multidrug transport system fused ATPase/permease subunit
MTQRIENILSDYIKTEVSQPDGTDYHRLVETGLWSLLNISSEVVDPIVNQVDSEYTSEKDAVETSYRTAADQLENEYNAAVNQVETVYKTNLDTLQDNYRTEIKNIKQKQSDQKREADSNSQQVLEDAEEEHNYAVMLSEVAEKETLKKYKINIHEIERNRASCAHHLGNLEENTQKLLDEYHFKTDDSKEAEQTVPENESDYSAAYNRFKDNAETDFHELTELYLPRVFLRPAYDIISVVVCLILGFFVWLTSHVSQWETAKLVTVAAVSLAVFVSVFLFLRILFRRKAIFQLSQTHQHFKEQIHLARKSLNMFLEAKTSECKQVLIDDQERQKSQLAEANEKYKKIKTETEANKRDFIQQVNRNFDKACEDLNNMLKDRQQQIESLKEQKLSSLKQEYDKSRLTVEEEYESNSRQVNGKYDTIRQTLKDSWLKRLDTVKALITRTHDIRNVFLKNWQDFDAWKHDTELEHQKLTRFGRINADFKQIAKPVYELMPDEINAFQQCELPATLSFPNNCSMFIQSTHTKKATAVGLIKSVMARLFISQPAGSVHFNIFDPIGLGENFVGFMHAVDYEKALVGGRIWTQQDHIQKCLNDLTAHMENVIQKYLRNEYETIEEYNQQAGELAEPYRFLVVADFPTNFNDESIRLLKSIINSGPKCGVYTLIVCDQNETLPGGISQEDLSQNGVYLISVDDGFQWQNDILKKIPLEVDVPPDEDSLTEIVQTVGSASIDSTKVEVPFELIAPKDHEVWSKSCTDEIDISIGRAGASRLQNLRLGKGVNQHILIAGKTGSGKSTLFHVMITNLGLWYSPDEIELYLIDFKQGVEFKTYATHKFPHAKVVAIESDREFGLSILQKLDLEMTQRGDVFRQARVQDIASYRNESGKTLSRIVLIVDEFQILFAEEDKIAQDSVMLLEKLVRQGRAFGIHIILGSQSLAGTAGISRSIMGQMAVRIAMHCSEMDTQYILNEDNYVASRLTRPGEAVYNDAGGLVVGNNPFQTAWLPKSTQNEYLARIKDHSEQAGIAESSMIVFEGNVPADIANNQILAANLENASKIEDTAKNPPVVYLGEPITIKSPTSVSFQRQNGANLLIVGQQEIAMTGVLCSTVISLLSSLSPSHSKFIIFDDNTSDSAVSEKIRTICNHFEHDCRFVNPGDVEDVIGELSQQLKDRLDGHVEETPSVFLIFLKLQHCRKLYRKEEDWSFNPSSEETVNVNKQFAEILQEGPLLGIHTIAGVDTFNTTERVFSRQTIREFNNRVLFQMSASDSNNFIDSPIANQLGFQRALLYNEEQGILEKFRYYAPPDSIGDLTFTDSH